MCRLSWNLGASTSWNPQGLSRSVMGLLYKVSEQAVGPSVYPGTKRSVCEADYWHPPCAEIQNEWIYAFPLHTSLMLCTVITLFCDRRTKPPTAGTWHHVTAMLLTLCNFRLEFLTKDSKVQPSGKFLRTGEIERCTFISHMSSAIFVPMLLSDVAKQLRKATESVCLYVHLFVQPSVCMSQRNSQQFSFA
jgi:hypothetical protein